MKEQPYFAMERVTFDEYENEDWRIDRLRLSLAWAIGTSQGALPIDQIVMMYDHKGELTVTWKTEKALDEWSGALDHAWIDFAGEPCIAHEVEKD